MMNLRGTVLVPPLASETVMKIVAWPTDPDGTATVNVRLLSLPLRERLASGRKFVSPERTVIVNALDGVSRSETKNGMATGAEFGAVVLVAGVMMVGAAFVTVRTKKSRLVPPCSSLTITVIMVIPNWLVCGVTWTLLTSLLPPNTMLASGTRLVFDERPVTTRLVASVCPSETLKLKGAVEVFPPMVWSGMLPMFGGVLETTLSSGVRDVENPCSSVTDMVMRLVPV